MPVAFRMIQAIDFEIEKIRSAIARREARNDELYMVWARENMPCCPSCAFSEYRENCDKNERAAEWLLRLLSKRGLVSDGKLANNIAWDYPNAWRAVIGTLPWVKKRGAK